MGRLMKALIKKTIRATPSDQKTNIGLAFTVPEGISALEIEYSYSPKELEDRKKSLFLIKENLMRDCGDEWTEYEDYGEFLPLKNLITLSLDSPAGYIGAAHRQAPVQKHRISPSFSSVGFVKAQILPGEWVLTLNLHAVVTDECLCEIEVKGCE